MRKIVIFGTGDVGQLARYYFEHDSEYEIAAFTADSEYIEKESAHGLPLVPFEEIEEQYPPDDFGFFVALSYRDLNQIRARKYAEAKAKGYELVSYVSSKSVIWEDVQIGQNCFIFENQTIQPYVQIGDDVTIWSGNHIGHHSTIGNHCFITSHVVISGHVEIGPYSFLGVNSTLRDGIRIAPRSVIGAGATVVEDTVEGGVYTGVAAELRSRKGGEIDYFSKTEYDDE